MRLDKLSASELDMNAHSLPPEIWLEIFECATYNAHLSLDNHVYFEPIPDSARDYSLPVKVAIASVCTTWQLLIAESLYKDVTIRHGAHALQRILEGRMQSGRRYGEMVSFCASIQISSKQR